MPRLMELADEFHLTTLEALDICDRLGIEAENLAADLSDDDADAFREAARGGLSAPAPVDDDPPEPAGPSLAKQLGMPSAPAPGPSEVGGFAGSAAPPPPPPPADDEGTAAPGGYRAFGAPVPGAAPPPAAAPLALPKPSLRDRLPGPIADNLPVVIVAVVVLVALVAYVVVSTSGTAPPKDPEELGLENASALTIDDCIDLPEGAEVSDLPEVDLVPSLSCAEPHDIELYAEVRSYQGDLMERRGEYPGTEKLIADSLAECIDRYEKAIGAPYRDSPYEVVVLAPTGALWVESNERVSLCGVMNPDGSKLESTVKGAAG